MNLPSNHIVLQFTPQQRANTQGTNTHRSPLLVKHPLLFDATKVLYSWLIAVVRQKFLAPISSQTLQEMALALPRYSPRQARDNLVPSVSELGATRSSI